MKQHIIFAPEFLNVSVFGSAARGDQDDLSDFDVIAVVEDGKGKQAERAILEWADANSMPMPSISWYGERKIKYFFETGDLFAWHLFLESKPLLNFPSLKNQFGRPARYDAGRQSISELSSILFEIPQKLLMTPRSLGFELGVAYVCLRNIAMSASWYLCDAPDFGRYSPFSISEPQFPLQKSDYQTMALCRISGQRGNLTPNLEGLDLNVLIYKTYPWVKEIKKGLLKYENS